MAKDLFSANAAIYARFRPAYPEALYQYILSFVKEKKCAWDCATGNGQAAAALAAYFDVVKATDISSPQLAHAIQKNNIQYSECPAEETPFDDNSFDLITVAQAYHWFAFDAFAAEAKRVARHDAVIAVFGYNLLVAADENINQLIHHFYTTTIGAYWDTERKYIDAAYKTIPFPFAPLPTTDLVMPVQWNKAELAGYIRSWSAVQHYIKANQHDPVAHFEAELLDYWPENRVKDFHFPLLLRLGSIYK